MIAGGKIFHHFIASAAKAHSHRSQIRPNAHGIAISVSPSDGSLVIIYLRNGDIILPSILLPIPDNITRPHRRLHDGAVSLPCRRGVSAVVHQLIIAIIEGQPRVGDSFRLTFIVFDMLRSVARPSFCQRDRIAGNDAAVPVVRIRREGQGRIRHLRRPIINLRYIAELRCQLLGRDGSLRRKRSRDTCCIVQLIVIGLAAGQGDGVSNIFYRWLPVDPSHMLILIRRRRRKRRPVGEQARQIDIIGQCDRVCPVVDFIDPRRLIERCMDIFLFDTACHLRRTRPGPDGSGANRRCRVVGIVIQELFMPIRLRREIKRGLRRGRRVAGIRRVRRLHAAAVEELSASTGFKADVRLIRLDDAAVSRRILHDQMSRRKRIT